MAKHWLVVFPDNKFLYLFNLKIAYKEIVVMPTDAFYPDDFRDIGETLVV